MSSKASVKRYAIVWISCFGISHSVSATEMICGPDPHLLTPLFPIFTRNGAPELGMQADVSFIFEGKQPCSNNECKLTIRSGASGRTFAVIRIDSEHVTYCHNKDNFHKLTPMIGSDGPGDCKGGVYSMREIWFRSHSQNHLEISATGPGVSIERLQNERTGGKSAFECRGPSASDDDLFHGRLLRFKTKYNGLLTLFETPLTDSKNVMRRLSSHEQN